MCRLGNEISQRICPENETHFVKYGTTTMENT